ncbi:FtsX-like permease family protein [Chitinophaga agrisoli]|uniref:FtsX-like permease family protein n=1 Tax=Chitinophaga agrisoli TaxID=2607653 RepID=A0A5B2VT76_9BACT|nr:ABC transporter permease [Chitinophaga agrisoli]KAA2241349.1 FtsX-like permease family protein [Chitinophaga agrisoli]
MFKNFLRITLRHLWKNKSYSFLNIFGLAIGITCAGFIFLWIEGEMSVDQSYPQKDQLYRIMTNQTYDGKTRAFNSTPGKLAQAIKEEIPGITASCRMSGHKALFSQGDKSIFEWGGYTDTSFFRMFDIQFTEGNVNDAFRQVNSVVLTEEMAQRFFGTASNVRGKILKVDNKTSLLVTGVIKDVPKNATLQFSWLSPFEIFMQTHDWWQYWGSYSVSTYVTLQPSADTARINRQLYGFIEKRQEGATARPFLFSMNDWHLRGEFEDGKQVGGRIVYVRMFGVIAWIILLIACINFMNLATARSEKRAREVGVRKVMGVAREMLTLQFIGEAITMAVLAVVLGLLIMWTLLPLFNTLVESPLSLGLNQPRHILYLVGIALLCGLVAGSYPSLYLSSFNPVAVLKGFKAKQGSAAWIRKGLVVFQFTTSIVLIVSTIIIYQQIQHMRQRDLGYDQSHLIQTDMPPEVAPHFAGIKQDLLNTGVVEEAGLGSGAMLYISNNSSNYSWQGKDENQDILISRREVSPGFMATWGLHLSAGRDFYTNSVADSNNVIITEAMAKLMGNGNPIGKTIRNGDDTYYVTGVVKDYVYGDMYGKRSDPVIFYCRPADADQLFIRIKPQVRPEVAMEKITAVMKADNPAYPFVSSFVDEQVNAFYTSEILIGKLSRVFAVLAIIISCLGLFGLAAYTAERRVKEIGIRKVLGASAAGITGLLSKDFLQLVGVAALIAFPLAWWGMHSWLQQYAYRINISGWVFVATAFLCLFITLLTVSFQAIKAAMANPIKSLRTE